MRVRMRREALLGISLMLAIQLMSRCSAANNQRRPRGSDDAALIAVRSVLDSVCSGGSSRCRSILINGAVMQAPNYLPAPPESVDVAFRLSPSRVAQAGLPWPTTVADFGWTHVADSVSVRVWIWLVAKGLKDPDAVAFTVAVLQPRSSHEAGVVELQRHGDRWVVSSVTFLVY